MEVDVINDTLDIRSEMREMGEAGSTGQADCK